jgi:predicted TPR repeat methyltransferase
VKQVELVDLVLKELVETHQPSISVRRVFIKHKIGLDEELIDQVESVLRSKSLVDAKSHDSAGYTRFVLSGTGQDFIKTYGTYAKFLKGIEKEKKRIEKAKNKKPYDALKTHSGEPPTAYVAPQKSFMQKNGLGLAILALFIILFYVVAKITG